MFVLLKGYKPMVWKCLRYKHKVKVLRVYSNWLELPLGELKGPREVWEIPPY